MREFRTKSQTAIPARRNGAYDRQSAWFRTLLKTAQNTTVIASGCRDQPTPSTLRRYRFRKSSRTSDIQKCRNDQIAVTWRIIRDPGGGGVGPGPDSNR